MGYNDEKDINVLLGKIIVAIKNREIEIVFACSDGTRYKMYHDQNCCESVSVDEIVGDLEDLLNSPITMAEKVDSSDLGARDKYDDSFTWTFYKLATVKGYVNIKWYGTSNGYYSESVSFEEIPL